MYGIGNGMFGQDDGQQDLDDQLGPDYGDMLTGRIMSAEANLAVQRGDGRRATSIFAQMAGEWLQRRFGGQ